MNEKEYLEFWSNCTNSRAIKKLDLINGVQIIVNSGVFNPSREITVSSAMIIDGLYEEDINGKKVLDLGTGTGILGIEAAVLGASCVTCVDISELSIENCKENVSANSQLFVSCVEVYESDLFSRIPSQNFDLILANLPILDECDHEEFTQKLLNAIPDYLSIKGEIWLTHASFGSSKRVENVLNNSKYDYQRQTLTHFGCNWYLYKIRNFDS